MTARYSTHEFMYPKRFQHVQLQIWSAQQNLQGCTYVEGGQLQLKLGPYSLPPESAMLQRKVEL
jgi:hypothetical protein